MRAALISDVHLEFGHCIIENEQNADVLILSGDICVASKFGPDDDRFFQQCSKKFKDVIYIMGNHEHYTGIFQKSEKILRDALSRYENIHFLEKSTVKIDDITFFGATLWTDMNYQNKTTISIVESMINDFRVIKNKEMGYSKLKALDVVQEHYNSLAAIKEIIETNPKDKYVFVGHHAPTKRSVKPRYEKDFHVNGGYSSDLSQFIIVHPQIKVWTHGHTHDSFDYMVGTTRVICNPRGYFGYEVMEETSPLLYFNI